MAGFHKSESFELPEAAKAVLNILFHESVLRENVVSSGHFEKSLDALEMAKDDLFFRLRFTFLCTIGSTGSETALKRPNTLSNLIEITEDFTKDPVKNNANLLELLRILYNISSDIQSLSDSEDLQSRLFAVVLSYLEMEEQAEASIIMKTEALVLLLNLSEQVLRANSVTEDSIIRVLEGIIEYSGEASTKMNIRASILAITRLVMLNEPLRKSLRHTILPAKWDRSVKPEEGDSVKSGLIRLLRSSDTNITAATGKLILTLCSNKVYRMVFHVGYGNAAGFLFNFGLLGQYQSSQAEFFQNQHLPEDASSDEELMFNDHLEGINPITGQVQGEAADMFGDDMTEEEKEAERERLADLFDKLEKTGVMKVIRK